MGSSYFRPHNSLGPFHHPISRFLFALSLSLDQEYPTSSSTLLDLSRSKCLSVREQVATRATWRDHSTKPNSRHPTRECWASNSSSQLSCCCTWIRQLRLLQLDDSRLDVVVLLTKRLWCGRVSGDVVVSAPFSQFVDGKLTKKMSLCERNYHSAPTTPGADKTKQKRHTDHLELIRCGWWQGAVSANTRGVQSKQTGGETTKIKKSNFLPVF